MSQVSAFSQPSPPATPLERALQWVRDDCPPWPSFGIGGGSAMEAAAQDRWRVMYGSDPFGVLWKRIPADCKRSVAR